MHQARSFGKHFLPGTMGGMSQWGGVHVGVLGLVLNGCVVLVGSLWTSGRSEMANPVLEEFT